MRKLTLLGALLTAGCNQPADNQAAGNVAANATAAAAVKHPTYCFFKDPETKGWSASANANGDVVVKGKAYRSDPRYRAKFIDQEKTPSSLTLWLAIEQNPGYASPDNWWSMAETVPDTAGVQTVTVKCGAKTLAELKIPRRG
jgi:hypothetical protein